MKNNSPIPKEKALAWLAKYCTARECCEFDLAQKAENMGLPPNEVSDILNYLRENKFFDNQRFAIAFANDRFKFGKWGRLKIAYALKHKKIPSPIIQAALLQIDDGAYIALLKSELVKKKRSLKHTDKYKEMNALYRFASGRGFESDLVREAIDLLD